MKRTGAILLAMLAMPASAQLLRGGSGGLGGLGSGLGSGLGGLTSGLSGQGESGGTIGNGLASSIGGLDGALAGGLRALDPIDLLAARRERLHALVSSNRAVLDSDAAGNPIRRDEILATDPAPDALAKATAAGFAIKRRETVDGLGIAIVVLATPKHLAARKALATLQTLDPHGAYALNHVYEPAHAKLAPANGSVAGGAAAGGAGAAVLGLIDGGVGAHPAFAHAPIEQRGFAGNPRPSGHGTAVASLMVGESGPFRGAAPGARLLAADIYGGDAANGSAEAIVRAIGWLVSRDVRVINISLVGAANPLLAAAVTAAQAKGVLIVAAVGNDGPAAPPQYPASYDGVIAVTGIDAKGRVLLEAGKATHLDFAAPGADMAGAVPGGGWEALRGTSFAAPLVAASLARADRGDPAQAIRAVAADARPGAKVGRGIVCGSCATPLRAVGLK
ncbi:MAG: S8 family serine peptidase [Sphingomonadaceae bacterium]|nr:S8 family serine peptidase [Sphingomonadaceae bacterium]